MLRAKANYGQFDCRAARLITGRPFIHKAWGSHANGAFPRHTERP
jgi:hypothetical protein